MIAILYIISIILILTGVQWMMRDRTQSRLTKDFEEIFTSSHIKLPILKFGSSYGWPEFTVTFWTRGDCEFALNNGLLDTFKKKLRTHYDKKFNPDRALHWTYIGYETPWKTIIVKNTERR
jgi:hypothetical protein